MTDETTTHPAFEWVGGRTCLDFANTVTWVGSERINERLGRYGDLLEWARTTEILDGPAIRRLRRSARAAPAAADAALQNAGPCARPSTRCFWPARKLARPRPAPRRR